MADICVASQRVCKTFKIVDLNAFQREAMEYFVKKKLDVFVNLPTGYGKSLIYQALPLVFDVTRNSTGLVVVVISPLVNLMKDQVESLQKLGIPAVSLGDIADREARALEDGRYRVVYGGGILRDEPKERLRRRLHSESRFVICSSRNAVVLS